MTYRKFILIEKIIFSIDEIQICDVDISNSKIFNEIWICHDTKFEKNERRFLNSKKHKILTQFMTKNEISMKHKTNVQMHKKTFDEWLNRQKIFENKKNETAFQLRKKIKQTIKNLTHKLLKNENIWYNKFQNFHLWTEWTKIWEIKHWNENTNALKLYTKSLYFEKIKLNFKLAIEHRLYKLKNLIQFVNQMRINFKSNDEKIEMNDEIFEETSNEKRVEFVKKNFSSDNHVMNNIQMLSLMHITMY